MQTNYAHWGDGNASCDDKASAFTNGGYCGTDDGTTVQTPDGDGKWHPVEDCDDTADDGTKLGSIEVGSTSHDCFAHKDDYDIYCALVDYACAFDMYCT